ncbi:hypothetical protein IIE18_10890 [Pseudomonas sp. V1]|uniref:GDSL-type esterase/lipase family protein n=1 Tax=Pseudomonas arcuscaelestis TaxID=2710591 RepID=UPI00193FE8CC|nr:GDSL-type esterase/lipase family protein [Pseudomonas arcuscaelestis]MBM3105646.1 hypothetical protein [Pseudomonas arcuscaelestis]
MSIDNEEEQARVALLQWQAGQGSQPLPEGLHPLGLFSKRITVVAQGDSWFNYLPGNDVVAWLDKISGYEIKNFATGGDTLENLVYGTEYRTGSWARKTPEFTEVLQAITEHKPIFFLFSGGGNDIGGDEFASFLNHADSKPTDLLRVAYVDYIVFTVFKKAYEDMVAAVKKVSPNIHILIHGYGRSIPTGLGVVNAGNFRFVGPWLRPSLTAKNITNPAVQLSLVTRVIDKFNEMLAQVAAGNPNVHYLDLRPYVSPADWANELHLTREGFKRVAEVFEAKMDSLVPEKLQARLFKAKTEVMAYYANLQLAAPEAAPSGPLSTIVPVPVSQKVRRKPGPKPKAAAATVLPAADAASLSASAAPAKERKKAGPKPGSRQTSKRAAEQPTAPAKPAGKTSRKVSSGLDSEPAAKTTAAGPAGKPVKTKKQTTPKAASGAKPTTRGTASPAAKKKPGPKQSKDNP